MVRERQIQREKTEIDSKGGVGGGMEGDDWTIWHPVNRGVLCASGPLWNRLLFLQDGTGVKGPQSCGGICQGFIPQPST